MRCELIAELATNHGGHAELAVEMITQAAENGADYVKTQGYQIAHLSQSDPQYNWLKASELSDDTHTWLIEAAALSGVRYMSTAYTRSDIARLRGLGVDYLKIGSGEGRTLAESDLSGFRKVFVSLPWGEGPRGIVLGRQVTYLAAVPLYPMPLECWNRIDLRVGEGYSDHAVGLTAAQIAIVHGAVVVEKHFSLPGKGRTQPWDMTPAMLRILRTWAEDCQAAMDGTRFEGRWRED